MLFKPNSWEIKHKSMQFVFLAAYGIIYAAAILLIALINFDLAMGINRVTLGPVIILTIWFEVGDNPWKMKSISRYVMLVIAFLSGFGSVILGWYIAHAFVSLFV